MADEIVEEFLVESRDSLDQLDRELVALESNPSDKQRLASIFRVVHTIKGTAGFLQYAKLESITHVGENLLSRLRDGVIVLESVRTSALLAMVDAIRTLLEQIEATELEGEGEYGTLVKALSFALEDATLPNVAETLGLTSAAPAAQAVPAAVPAAAPEPPMVAEPPMTAPQEALAEIAAPTKLVTPMSAQQTATSEKKPAADKRGSARTESDADQRIRVDVKLLDRLMNLVGELVLARNQLLQHAGGSVDVGLVSTCQRLNLITSELQENVMKTRMQPIENVWNRFPRVVRDLAQTCGKQVKLEMEGGSTELDKTIIEAIGDPLTHLVRNSIDHGIEPAAARAAAGKPAVGTLRLSAYHEGGRVNIEIGDDGRGIDGERVKKRALERGLITPERARAMAEHEIHALLFAPGFSTAEQITNISGRGVGLDVVKSNIEKLGGSVDIDSTFGRGATFRIRIPLTLAIIPALMVGVHGERYAIPQVNLAELVRFDAEQADKLIEYIDDVPVYRLRGNLLPLVSLCDLLGLGERDRARDANLIVLAADERQFGLLVDEIFDTEEIVVKPLGRELKGLDAYAGATIMGDGRVALILDVLGLAERAGVGAIERKIKESERPRALAGSAQQLLLFRPGKSSRMALPLDSVARLEEFQRTQVEQVGDHDVVQYRGDILPLLYLSEVFGEPRSHKDTLQVLVHGHGEHQIGLVVDAIDDVIQQEIVASRRGGRPGTLGSAVIQGKVTEILDADSVRGLAGGWP